MTENSNTVKNNGSNSSGGSGGASGAAYATSKEGIVRVLILIAALITFALIAANGYGGVGAWILAAFILAFCITFFSYFFILTTLASNMQCGIAYETVDFVISVIMFFHCFAAAIVLAMYNCSQCSELIAANIFGFITVILYFVEIYFTQQHAPEPMKYLITKNGIVKLVVVVFGCISFALLVRGGYNCSNNNNNGCDSGRTFALAAFVISWTGSMIILLLHVTGLGEKIGPFKMIDFIWTAFSFFFFLIASIVLAVYVECSPDCYPFFKSYRVGACVFGFFTTIAYLVEAILLKTDAPSLAQVST